MFKRELAAATIKIIFNFTGQTWKLTLFCIFQGAVKSMLEKQLIPSFIFNCTIPTG